MSDRTFNPKILLVHPGTQHSYKLAGELSKRKYLLYFYTGFAIIYQSVGYGLLRTLPASLRKKFAQRIIYGIRSKELKLLPFHEIKALIGKRRKRANNNIFFERNEAFQKDIPELAIQQSDAVISYDTASWILAKRSIKAGKYFFLDVSTTHSESKQRAYKKLRADYPDWQPNIEMKRDEHMALEQKEYELADALVVACSFAKNTLIGNGVDPQKIYVNPYGVDLNKFFVKRNNRPNEKVRFLFVGTLDAGKGIPLLMTVFKRLQQLNVELNLVGFLNDDVVSLIKKEKLSTVNIVGKVSHDELPALFHSNDVFVFPSFFEGFGLVILEAMASGLPVITTTATAGPDIIENGQEGFVIEPGDVEGLERTIRSFIANVHLIATMGDKARAKAETFTWSEYGNRWIKIIDSVMRSNNKQD
jgi:alpha-maltose-1-phosphate synthase